eukprot:365426-Chlamydomonas_euryale.AAC.2
MWLWAVRLAWDVCANLLGYGLNVGRGHPQGDVCVEAAAALQFVADEVVRDVAEDLVRVARAEDVCVYELHDACVEQPCTLAWEVGEFPVRLDGLQLPLQLGDLWPLVGGALIAGEGEEEARHAERVHICMEVGQVATVPGGRAWQA